MKIQLLAKYNNQVVTRGSTFHCDFHVRREYMPVVIQLY
jgi:hypothetical protein